jgi:hypothetical protein
VLSSRDVACNGPIYVHIRPYIRIYAQIYVVYIDIRRYIRKRIYIRIRCGHIRFLATLRNSGVTRGKVKSDEALKQIPPFDGDFYP